MSMPPPGQYGGPPPYAQNQPQDQPQYPQYPQQAAPGYPMQYPMQPVPAYGTPWGFIPPPPVRHQGLPTPLQLIPIHHWFKDRSLRNWITILFVVLVVTPSVALYVLGTYNVFTQAAWVFAVYFAGLWLVILWVTVRPPMVKPWMLAEIAVIGLVLETPAAMWMEKTFNTNSNGIFAMIFTVGLPEETVKALPVLVLAVVHRKQWASLLPKDYLFIGAVSGLAFGASEAVLYTTSYMPSLAISSAQQGAGPAQIAAQSIFEGSWRLLTDPISHAIWAGIAGYFIGLAIRYPRGRVFVGLFGLTLVAVLHGINDRLAGEWGWIFEVAFSVLLFIVYVQAGGVIEHELEDLVAVVPGQPGQAPGSVPGQLPPAQFPGQVPGQYSGQYAGQQPGQYPGQYPNQQPGQYPGQAPAPASGWPQGPAPTPAGAGYGQWAPAPGYAATGPGYPVAMPVQAAPMYVAPAFNPAGGWGSTGFTQLPSGVRKQPQQAPQPQPVPPQSQSPQAIPSDRPPHPLPSDQPPQPPQPPQPDQPPQPPQPDQRRSY